MAAIDTPWVMSFTPGSSQGEDEWGNNLNLPTTAAFSPINISKASMHKPKSTILGDQKSSLLVATPPQIIRVLAHSHHFLLPLNKIVGLITWSTDDPWESFLLVTGFWGLILYGDLVLRYTGPLLIIIGILASIYSRRYSPLSSSGRTSERPPRISQNEIDSEKTNAKYQKTLDEIVETLDIFTVRCQILIDPLLKLTDFLSVEGESTSPALETGLGAFLIRFLIITPIWIILSLHPVQIITTKRIVLTIGTVFLTWHSQPNRITRKILWRSNFIRWVCSLITGLRFSSKNFSDSKLPETHSSSSPQQKKDLAGLNSNVSDHSLKDQNEVKGLRVKFTFILYENQRRWIGLGWTNNLFSYERAAWTDEHLNPASSKDNFELPHAEDETTMWRWVEGSQWLVEGAEETDEGGVRASYAADGGMGWIYYDNKWQNGRRGLDSWSRYTRRRKWYRDAELVEVVQLTETAPAIKISSTSKSFLSAIKSAMPSSITAPTISPPSLTPTDAMSIQSSRDSPGVSTINSRNSSRLGSFSCKEDFKKRSVSYGVVSSAEVGRKISVKSGSNFNNKTTLRRGTGTRRRSSVSMHSSTRSFDWSDDDIALKMDGDWGIGDDARMGID